VDAVNYVSILVRLIADIPGWEKLYFVILTIGDNFTAKPDQGRDKKLWEKLLELQIKRVE
jgi:hypothetical protein